MTQYSMTPFNSGTRMRTDHNVFASVIASYTRGQLVVGDEIWEAPADGSDKPAVATDAPKTPAVKRVRKAVAPGSEGKGE